MRTKLSLAAQMLGLPARPAGAMTGSQFIARTKSYSPKAREDAIFAEVRRGNVPQFLRQLVPVEVKAGRQRGTVWVMPDYLAIGSDSDFVRIPMTPITAQRLADQLGVVLPTPKLVDTIYEQAQVKLAPQPLPHGRTMVTNDYYLRHQNLIERQRSGFARGALVAGQKKDIVLTNRLLNQPRRVAIYGWHRKNGKAIQPLSLVHGDDYADYSHGVRFIASSMVVDGRQVRVAEVLESSSGAVMLSYEGKMRTTRLTPDASSRRYVASNATVKHQPAATGRKGGKKYGAALASNTSSSSRQGRLPKIKTGPSAVRGGAVAATATYKPKSPSKKAPSASHGQKQPDRKSKKSSGKSAPRSK